MVSPAAQITLFFWLLLIASIVGMVASKLRLPYAAALVVTGLVIGIPHLLPQAHLDPDVLFMVLLPPLLFDAAINLPIEPLRADWRALSLYAFGGTLISAIIVGELVALLLHIPIGVALIFGALIAPTDPISVLAIFRRLGIDKRLSLIVEGESLFNDGIGVVLFTVFVGAATGGQLSVATGILEFVIAVLGGVVVGVGLGALASRLSRGFDDRLLEITLTTVAAYGSYLCAQALHVSGVIAVVAAGITVGNYGMRKNMSTASRVAVQSFWEYAAFIVNSIVFLLIGIDEANVVGFWRDGWIVMVVIAIVLFARAVSVYALAPLAGKGEKFLPMKWRHVLFWGSLRGALSMALALGLPLEVPHRDLIVLITFGVVLFSLLVQGLSMGKVLDMLGLSRKGQTEFRL